VPSKTLLDIALKQYRLSPEKVQYIASGVDTQRFRPPEIPRERLRPRGVGDAAVLFGYAGHLRPEKDLNLLLRAFALADLGAEAGLVIAGSGSCKAELETLSRSLGIEDRVIFAGFFADTSILYGGIDVFVLSSATEQMPMALAEAMSSGLPAICTDVGDCAELLGSPGAPEIAPPDDVNAYASALRTVARDPALRARLGAKNRERCLSRYTAARMVKEYSAVYRAALS
jgi:glycosyltransferase involved in cell wall biosynthesis